MEPEHPDRTASFLAIRARHARLSAEVRGLERGLARLEARARKEDEDVRAIERQGFASLVRSLLGSQQERLTQERGEALEAALLRDRARTTLASARAELERVEREVSELETAAPIDSVPAEARALPSSGPPRSADLAALARATTVELEAVILALRSALEAVRRGPLSALLASDSAFDALDAATRRWILARKNVFALSRATGVRLRLPHFSIVAAQWMRSSSSPTDRDGKRALVAERIACAIGDLHDVRRELLRIAEELERKPERESGER